MIEFLWLNPPEQAQSSSVCKMGPEGGVIGRGSDVYWNLNSQDPFLEERHVLIEFEEGAYSLRNLNTHSTVVDGAHFLEKEESCLLSQGKQFCLGSLLFQVTQLHIPIGIPELSETEPSALPILSHSVAAPLSDSDDFLEQFETFFSLPKGLLSRDRQAGSTQNILALLKLLLERFLELLQHRLKQKHEMGLEGAGTRRHQQNPLNLASTAQQALLLLMSLSPESGGLEAQSMVDQAVTLLTEHQEALYQAILGGVEGLLDSISPASLQKTYAIRHWPVMDSFYQSIQAWPRYVSRYHQLKKNNAALAKESFLAAFTQSYGALIQGGR